MKALLKLGLSLVAVLAAVACGWDMNSGGVATTGQSAAELSFVNGPPRDFWGQNVSPACNAPLPGYARCLALVRSDIPGRKRPGSIEGLSPADLQSAYKLPSSTRGAGQIVAIVDAYDNPAVTSDLATYRSAFGLPPANFTKYNQKGRTGRYPKANVGWGSEIDLDVDMVSASCPKCTIYLIEANSADSNDFQTAEVEAVTLGAHIISNSWICSGSLCEDQSAFDAPGVTYLAAAGDFGYGVLGVPMEFPSVVAVGGTTLQHSGNKRAWFETAWKYSGSGCASGVAKPFWQHDPDCTSRMTSDVAADADPNTGAAVYDSFGYGGWVIVGGTSQSSPLLAGIFGLAGNPTEQNGGETFWIKKTKVRHLYPVTVGKNGSCSPNYFCTDGTHEYEDYGGPTGWGTPRGIGQF